MYSIDLRTLAESSFLGEGVEKGLKPLVLEIVVGLCVGYYNHSYTEEGLREQLDSIAKAYMLEDADEIFYDIYRDMTSSLNKMHWDRRLKINYEVLSIRGVIHKVRIKMDLDATLNYYSKKENTIKPKVKLGDLVEENPTPEMMNALLHVPN